jgi:hypothetical protein
MFLYITACELRTASHQSALDARQFGNSASNYRREFFSVQPGMVRVGGRLSRDGGQKTKLTQYLPETSLRMRGVTPPFPIHFCGVALDYSTGCDICALLGFYAAKNGSSVFRCVIPVVLYHTYTVCPTRYRTRHFFNNSNTNEDIATKFEYKQVRCVRNEEECVCSPLQISLQYPH